MDNPLFAFPLSELRQRRSDKWRAYPADVLPLWVAEMDTPLAPPVAEALVAAVSRGDTGYAHPGELPEAFADFARRRYGWRPEPATTRLVPDVMCGITEALRVLTPPGASVVVNTPAYPPFFAWLRITGRRLVESPLRRTASGYRLDLDRLERDFAAGAAAYLLCNPHNPTGWVADAADLRTVADLADRYGVRVVVDEIHAPLTYPGVRHIPFAMLDAPAAARSITAVSASKAWNLPGLKAALLIAGPDAVRDLRLIPAEVETGSGLFGVIASEAAFRSGGPWLDALIAGLDANRALLGRALAEDLPEVGYRPPDGTYLAWLDCRGLDLGSAADPAAEFLARGRVAVTSGPLFGDAGRGFVRLNMATSPDILRQAVRRMAAVRTAR